MLGDLSAKTISFGPDGIEGYLATPADDGPRGSVVVIHHLPGYDEGTKEIARTFAAHGYAALVPNLYARQAPGADPDDAAAAVRAAGGIADEQLVGDVTAAAEHLRGLPGSNGRVGSIGYCSGGRHSFLAATAVDLQAAVDCYGAFVVGTVPEGFPLKVTPLTDRIEDLRCPVLGLFGQDDSYPPPADMEELDRLLTAAGKEHAVHYYEGAGHAFFSTDRPSYRPEAAKQGWAEVWDFFGTHLGS